MAPISDSKSKGQRRQDLFDLSISLDPAERNDFLVRQCAGDDVLRREVLALIRESEAKDGKSAAGGRDSAGLGEPYRPGQRLGHYLIHDRIGHGGMGIVYRALDERLDRTVALKCLPPHLSRDDVSRQRFIVEAKSASRLDHPNICVIYDIGDSESGDLFLTMPYYDGETLDKRVARGPLSLTEAMSVTAQLCEGLSAAHDEGIVHRDIKPSNILLTTSGVVKILDFGLAKMGRLEMTQTGFQVGTLAYMAPERLAGGEVDLRADLWALGVVLTDSNIDLSYPNVGMRVDRHELFPVDRLLGETGVVFESEVEQIRARFERGNEVRVALGFWPTWPHLYLARPIRVADPGCLVCHGAVQDAPKTMVDLYGDANGFGWKLNEVVGSQVVSVPMSIPLDRAMGAFETFMLLTGLVFVALAIVLNLLLHRIVIRPVMRMSAIAEDISMGNLDAPEFGETGTDEIGSLAPSFNRMRRSLVNAMKMLNE